MIQRCAKAFGELDAKSVSDGDNDVVKEAVGVVESLDMRLVLESGVSSDGEFETISVREVVTESNIVSASVSVASGVEERLFVLEIDIACLRVAVCDAVSREQLRKKYPKQMRRSSSLV